MLRDREKGPTDVGGGGSSECDETSTANLAKPKFKK